jgi:hypothetical protein
MHVFEERLADELAGLAGRSAAEIARTVQGLVASFSQDELRDDMTILVARVGSPPVAPRQGRRPGRGTGGTRGDRGDRQSS